MSFESLTLAMEKGVVKLIFLKVATKRSILLQVANQYKTFAQNKYKW